MESWVILARITCFLPGAVLLSQYFVAAGIRQSSTAFELSSCMIYS